MSTSDTAASDSSNDCHPENGSNPLTPRHRELARLAFLGKSQAEIAKTLKFSTAWTSRLLSSPRIIAEIDRLHDRAFDTSIGDRLKDLSSHAMDVIYSTLMSNDPHIKPSLRAETARWVVEKLSGKPRQEIETKDGNLTDFMTLLKQMKEDQQNQLPVATDDARNDGSSLSTSSYIDVSPKEKDPLEIWIDENL